MENYNSDEIKYLEAKKRVKRIKGFYTHLIVYVCVNLFIAYYNYQDLKPGESYFQFHNFLTLFFWGIGLAVHGLSVFLPNFILGNDWEERKTRELMDKYK
ncbi:2TM domain-containing protein [Halpernia sp.]|uniref:2TM domain-containing protein n=1 Tax=Halpernia sp. TaxID=2782209 RepID=UPI003A8F37D2